MHQRRQRDHCTAVFHVWMVNTYNLSYAVIKTWTIINAKFKTGESRQRTTIECIEGAKFWLYHRFRVLNSWYGMICTTQLSTTIKLKASLHFELLNVDLNFSTNILYVFIRKIWRTESIPKEWKKGLIIIKISTSQISRKATSQTAIIEEASPCCQFLKNIEFAKSSNSRSLYWKKRTFVLTEKRKGM